jgi:plasmid stabilization system protein ParE
VSPELRRLRWTERAVGQLAAIAEQVSLGSPIYAEQLVDRVVRRLTQACHFPESGRVVPEYEHPQIRELLELPYRLIYRVESEAIVVLGIVHARRLLVAQEP